MKGSTGVLLGLVLGVLATASGAYYWREIKGLPLPFGDALRLSSGGGGASSSPPVSPITAANASAGKERKLLYYRNPMGLPDTSPTPRKDPMGMDYIPVYEEEEEEKDEDGEPASASRIKISTEKIQKLGVRTEAAQRRALDKVVRAVGRVEPDERRLYAISPKFEGYVERLHVNVTGQPIHKGQALFDIYSPELVSAQREYALAAQGVEALQDADEPTRAGMRQLAEASLSRLRNWDISSEQIKSLARSGTVKRTLSFRSPVAGVVTEKKALQGMRFMPGEVLYQVADLSSVWVIADVFEQDIGLVASGSPARVRINAYPERLFEGQVSYVYPTLNAATRTAPVRIELDNPGLLLKPAMFAQVELPVETRAAALTVPTSAVIDSGTRRIVLVELGEGRFEPREVRLGARGDKLVEILDGVREGEPVVVAANFLIDAESNLKAALGGFGAAPPPPPPGSRAAAVSHRAEGQVDEIDAASGALTVSHGPVDTLHWPAMTMEFKAAHAALLQGLGPGDRIAFEFVERAPGEWVITAISKEVKEVEAGGVGAAHEH
ncbi:MAG: efflux RND transporter periplasmic adaptor subunit [Candidatus Accumulibacter sp.]|jgi:Cu(I)/Ag(I) efflux system membrane fusion protein|nr:efflux RND transporter periplasmic adaptor subunit [Accumulibacter sp.]